MKIIEYNDNYLEDVRDLLVELEEYIISIDKDNLDCIHEEYREKMALVDLDNVEKYNGKCYLAIEDDKAVGLIMGYIGEYSLYDYLDYKCPKCGIVSELIVSKNVRGKGIGNLLLDEMEIFFKNKNCKIIKIDVFSYNDNAIKFYDKKGYHSRMICDIKIIE